MAGVYRNVLAVSLLATIWPSLALGQATKAGVVTNLQGNVTAVRTTQPQPVPLKFKDDVLLNDRVVAGDRSLARLLLGGRAVVTVRERSALTITQIPSRTTIDLDSGKIAVAVAKDRMQPGDQIEVKTPNAVAAVRGTVFVVEVIRSTADASGAPSLPSRQALPTLPTLPQPPVNNPNGPPVHGGVGGDLNRPPMRPPINDPLGSASSTCRPVAR